MIGFGLMLGAASLVLLPSSPARLSTLHPPNTVVSIGTRSRTTVLVIAGVVAAVSALAVGGVGALCAVAAIGATVRTRWRRASLRRLREIEIESLTAGLDIVIGELGVGSHPASACAAVASEGKGSAAEAFGYAASRARLGGDAYIGLTSPDSAVSIELSRLASAWKISDEYGIGLADLLATARADLLSRKHFRDRTRASLAGARATGTVLAALPVLGVLLGQMMGARPLSVLMGGGLGGVLLAIGSILVCAGLVWTDAITERVTR